MTQYKADDNNRLVYSSEYGATCSKCGKSRKKCKCTKQPASPAGDGVVRISRETKGRKGKGVTVISGIALNEEGLKQLGKRLKAKCGSGGTVKNGVIEIQGDHRDLLVEELKKAGYTAKRAGG